MTYEMEIHLPISTRYAAHARLIFWISINFLLNSVIVNALAAADIKFATLLGLYVALTLRHRWTAHAACSTSVYTCHHHEKGWLCYIAPSNSTVYKIWNSNLTVSISYAMQAGVNASMSIRYENQGRRIMYEGTQLLEKPFPCTIVLAIDNTKR